MLGEARTRSPLDQSENRELIAMPRDAARSHRGKSQMAAGDPLAQFRPVSLHPPASLLHPAASCVTSPATLGHPRLQRPPLLHSQRSHSRRRSAPPRSCRKCGDGREDAPVPPLLSGSSIFSSARILSRSPFPLPCASVFYVPLPRHFHS